MSLRIVTSFVKSERLHYLGKGLHMLQRARVQSMMGSALMLVTESAKLIIFAQ